MDLQQLMRTMAQINKVFVPYDEAERRRENEIRTRFPNTEGPIGYDTSYLFGDDEYVETYDEYLRRTNGQSLRQSLDDLRMGQPQSTSRQRFRELEYGGQTPSIADFLTDKDEKIMMRNLIEMMGLK